MQKYNTDVEIRVARCTSMNQTVWKLEKQCGKKIHSLSGMAMSSNLQSQKFQLEADDSDIPAANHVVNDNSKMVVVNFLCRSICCLLFVP